MMAQCPNGYLIHGQSFQSPSTETQWSTPRSGGHFEGAPCGPTPFMAWTVPHGMDTASQTGAIWTMDFAAVRTPADRLEETQQIG